MSDYEVGYGKPPKHSRFRKGVCANPRGRGKRRRFEAEEILKAVLFALAALDASSVKPMWREIGAFVSKWPTGTIQAAPS